MYHKGDEKRMGQLPPQISILLAPYGGRTVIALHDIKPYTMEPKT